MQRWLVKLEGDQLDLKEFPKWFPTGEVSAIEEHGSFFITGPALNKMAEPDAVLKRATEVLNEFAGIIFLLWPSLRKPVISQVISEDDSGARKTYAYTTGTAHGRSKASGISADASGKTQPPSTTHAQDLLFAAGISPHLQEALRVWSEPPRHWGRLRRVMEEIERHIKDTFDKELYQVGLPCSRNECGRFMRTAQSAETAGLDSCHASSDKHRPPTKPMSLEEATSFIGRLLVAALLTTKP